jgi:hypothetical protein
MRANKEKQNKFTSQSVQKRNAMKEWNLGYREIRKDKKEYVLINIRETYQKPTQKAIK